MRYLRFFHNGKILAGVVGDNDDVHILEGDMFGVHDYLSEQIPLAEVSILPPTIPTKIVCVGLNYKGHAEEMGAPMPDEPVIFLKPATALLQHGKEIVYPVQSSRVDYEAELGIVIKRDCRNVPAEKAHEVIFGYTCVNDVTARDLQTKDGQWTRAKSFDTFCPVGPWVKTRLDANNVAVRSYLNGTLRQDGHTSDFIFPVEKVIEFVSSVMTLKQGDIVTTGTPAGIGPMKPGDEVAVEVEGVGTLVNRVKQGSALL